MRKILRWRDCSLSEKSRKTLLAPDPRKRAEPEPQLATELLTSGGGIQRARLETCNRIVCRGKLAKTQLPMDEFGHLKRKNPTHGSIPGSGGGSPQSLPCSPLHLSSNAQTHTPRQLWYQMPCVFWVFLPRSFLSCETCTLVTFQEQRPSLLVKIIPKW